CKIDRQPSLSQRATRGSQCPIERGYVLSDDDCIRRYVIGELMCNFFVDRRAVGAKFGIEFDTYFAAELQLLSGPDGPVADGFVRLSPEGLASHRRAAYSFATSACTSTVTCLDTRGSRPSLGRFERSSHDVTNCRRLVQSGRARRPRLRRAVSGQPVPGSRNHPAAWRRRAAT